MEILFKFGFKYYNLAWTWFSKTCGDREKVVQDKGWNYIHKNIFSFLSLFVS